MVALYPVSFEYDPSGKNVFVTCLTLSVPDVISGRGDVGLITLAYVCFTQITLRV